MPEHAADDGDREKGSASIGPSVKLRLCDTRASAAGAPTYSQPSDEYRQETAGRSYDVSWRERARPVQFIPVISKTFSLKDMTEPHKKHKGQLTYRFTHICYFML